MYHYHHIQVYIKEINLHSHITHSTASCSGHRPSCSLIPVSYFNREVKQNKLQLIPHADLDIDINNTITIISNIKNDIEWVRQNTTLYYGVGCPKGTTCFGPLL